MEIGLIILGIAYVIGGLTMILPFYFLFKELFCDYRRKDIQKEKE